MTIDRDLYLVLVGGALALLGGVIGAWLQAWVSYIFEKKRAVDEERKRWANIALEWAKTGRKENFRHVDLQGTDLRGVDLGPAKEGDIGADLSYSNLQGANLNKADLRMAHLRGVRMSDAKLTKVSLNRANLAKAKYDTHTKWPHGFTPPPDAINVDEQKQPTPQSPT